MISNFKAIIYLLISSVFLTACKTQESVNNPDDQNTKADISWEETKVINKVPVLNYSGDFLQGPDLDTHSGQGSQYGRMLKLNNITWLAVYIISNNYGYRIEEDGGYMLEIAKSGDKGNTWKPISMIEDEGRYLDNGQMILLSNGTIILACRSVKWKESYLLTVYKSSDNGLSWTRNSIIDSNEGSPGELGNPDKGICEPHLLILDNGKLAVMYANEKHVIDAVSCSQIISEKISEDFGESWGNEIWAVNKEGKNSSRTGMPVWSKMKNDKYILFYEICDPEECNIYYKISDDGLTWPSRHGIQLPNQSGTPYVLSMDEGFILVVTSDKGNFSTSIDFGNTWYLTQCAWQHTSSFIEDWAQTISSSIYEIEPEKISI
tara:strand:+ start:4813 stop:5943 length:1131 start_codon:yes stop_codon:yes gene_type:complete